MKIITMCHTCKSNNIRYLGNNYCFCFDCDTFRKTEDKVVESRYEKTRRMVYATGNRWAIENFEATH